MKLLNNLYQNKLINPPRFLLDNTHYITITGSEAYGMSQDKSDKDLIGFCIEPREYIMPSCFGNIIGFDQIPTFESFQKHGIEFNNQNYDVTIYGIVKFFKLLLDATPNSVEALYTPRDCVIFSTNIGEMVRANRSLFLCKRLSFKCRMYGFSQIKLLERNAEGKRKALVEKYGYDVKAGSHCVRLLNMAHDILLEEELDIRKHADKMKFVRGGGWAKQELVDWANYKEKELEKLESTSKIQQIPDKEKVKNLLLNCIEHHYGKIAEFSRNYESDAIKKLEQIQTILGTKP